MIRFSECIMLPMGYMSYEEFLADLERLDQEKKDAAVYRYYIQIPHVTADRIPSGYTRFERWNSRPYSKDAGQEAYGVVEYPRPLDGSGNGRFRTGTEKNLTTDLTT